MDITERIRIIFKLSVLFVGGLVVFAIIADSLKSRYVEISKPKKAKRR
jgi:hypothetical protein